MAGFRKRVRAGARFARSKRSKTMSRRRFPSRRSGPKSIGFTTQSGSARNLGFKSRRVRPRQWRRILWRDTLAETHYRSNGAVSGTMTTIAGAASAVVVGVRALQVSGTNFWLSAGGLNVHDSGLTVPPLFEGDLVIRGGKMGGSLYNESTTVPVMAEVLLVRDSGTRDTTNLPASVPVGWDPSLIVDFQQDIGKIIMRKKFLILPTESAMFEYRMRPMKVDQGTWGNSQFTWYFVVYDFDNTATNTVRRMTFFNLSFAGDVKTPAS